MNFIKNHFLILDMLDEDRGGLGSSGSYGIGLKYFEVLEKSIDDKGEFEIRKYYKKWYCGCHPETCSHSNGMIYKLDEIKKVYIN